jgi:CRISPR-associated protein Csc2
LNISNLAFIFLDIVTLKDVTADEFRYIVGISSSPVAMVPFLVASGPGWKTSLRDLWWYCRITQFLELIQAIHDDFIGADRLMEHQLEDAKLVEATKKSCPMNIVEESRSSLMKPN